MRRENRGVQKGELDTKVLLWNWFLQHLLSLCKNWYTYCRPPQQICNNPINHCYMFRSFWPSSGIKYMIFKTQNKMHIYIYIYIYIFFFWLWLCDPTRVMASSFTRFLDHTQRRTTVRRTPLDEWSARRRDLYLTTHNTHNRQISMPPVEFEPIISAGERPQTYALDRAATGTDISTP